MQTPLSAFFILALLDCVRGDICHEVGICCQSLSLFVKTLSQNSSSQVMPYIVELSTTSPDGFLFVFQNVEIFNHFFYLCLSADLILWLLHPSLLSPVICHPPMVKCILSETVEQTNVKFGQTLPVYNVLLLTRDI